MRSAKASTAPAIGQRVTMAGLGGAWTEYFVAPAARAVPLPDAVSDEIGCQISAMPMSAMMALADLGVKPGEWMIQNAATGAVGKTLAMIAKARGIRVVNLVRREAGIAELAALGVGEAVSTADKDWPAEVAEITGGAPIVAALDSVGGEESGQLLHLLANGGTLMSFGAMGGKPMMLNPGDLIFKQAIVKGFWGSKRSAALSREDGGAHDGRTPAPCRDGRAEAAGREKLRSFRGRRRRARERRARPDGQDRVQGVRVKGGRRRWTSANRLPITRPPRRSRAPRRPGSSVGRACD